MDAYLAIAWMISGLVAGVVLGVWLNPTRGRHRTERARAAAQDQQHRRTLDKLRASQREMNAQLESATQRHTRQVEQLKQAHAAELRVAEDELRDVRQQLSRMADAAECSGMISGTAFEPTRFDQDQPL
jgi:C4-dicarboxylate-specific signal transduction histidine kinase